MSRADDAAGGVPQQLISRDSSVVSPDEISVEPAAVAVESFPVPVPMDAASTVRPAFVESGSQDLPTLDPPGAADVSDTSSRTAAVVSASSNPQVDFSYPAPGLGRTIPVVIGTARNSMHKFDDLLRLPVDEVKRQAAGLHLLNLCGGPERADSVAVFVQTWGARITEFDVALSPEHDLCDEGRWNLIRQDLQDGSYHGVGNASPCSTFSGARRHDGGPRPLRGEFAPEIYGYPNLSPEEKQAHSVVTSLVRASSPSRHRKRARSVEIVVLQRRSRRIFFIAQFICSAGAAVRIFSRFPRRNCALCRHQPCGWWKNPQSTKGSAGPGHAEVLGERSPNDSRRKLCSAGVAMRMIETVPVTSFRALRHFRRM